MPGQRSKYGNKRVQYQGITFDSILERDRWIVLQARQRDGKISSLERQITVPLEVNGVLVCKLIVDFRYRDATGNVIFEDAKGIVTDSARIKLKLFEAVTGQTVRLIKKESLHA